MQQGGPGGKGKGKSRGGQGRWLSRWLVRDGSSRKQGREWAGSKKPEAHAPPQHLETKSLEPRKAPAVVQGPGDPPHHLHWTDLYALRCGTCLTCLGTLMGRIYNATCLYDRGWAVVGVGRKQLVGCCAVLNPTDRMDMLWMGKQLPPTPKLLRDAGGGDPKLSRAGPSPPSVHAATPTGMCISPIQLPHAKHGPANHLHCVRQRHSCSTRSQQWQLLLQCASQYCELTDYCTIRRWVLAAAVALSQLAGSHMMSQACRCSMSSVGSPAELMLQAGCHSLRMALSGRTLLLRSMGRSCKTWHRRVSQRAQ